MPDDRERPRATSPRGAAPTGGFEVQHDWDSRSLHGEWPRGRDSSYLMDRHTAEVVAMTAAGARGPLLEVAAAEAVHACRLQARGLEAFVVEPSPAMLVKARHTMRSLGARVALVRGIAEALPFPDGTFDRVLCESAIDHLASPGRAVGEMARVLRPDGRLVIGVVNYGSLSVRLSRVLYRVARALRLLAPDRHLFWDSPVPDEHTFECTLPVLTRLCSRYLDLERTIGVSIGWAVPGWSRLLDALPAGVARRLLRLLDRFGARAPGIADYVVTVWRPRAAALAPADDWQATPEDPAYRRRLREEIRFWSTSFNPALHRIFTPAERLANEALTGDGRHSWREDLIARGPFRHAAHLGCGDAGDEAAWVAARASEHLDIYEITPAVIRRVRRSLPRRDGVRFVHADLNFLDLPPARYDVVWASGVLHHVVNLEHLFSAVERALTDDGLFAFFEYVGEPRHQYAAHRLARVNALLREVPVRFRLGGIASIDPPAIGSKSPFCAIRSAHILTAAESRFERVHLGRTGALFPLLLHLDLAALEREAPALLARLRAAEAEAAADPRLPPSGAYAVFRKRRH